MWVIGIKRYLCNAMGWIILSNFDKLSQLYSQNFLEYVDFWPKILLFRPRQFAEYLVYIIIAWIFHTVLCMEVQMLLQKRCLSIIRKDRPFCKYLLIHQTSFFTFMPKGARIVRAPQGGYGLARVRDYARVLWFCSGL